MHMQLPREVIRRPVSNLANEHIDGELKWARGTSSSPAAASSTAACADPACAD
eukprot:CAMPEP_0174709242 /NCGR_PEP_ID=MMETSP1094-20130205/11268_1 /TAXON_ID=156173 /ORGANISM="Chrysochromulina brevifilum, Strain UTEX LB 985" /LENGTH=52 /DNA_ID=CAMNT_0015907899 /DNA_START=316 /DNA_END=472 /DNA_ORIENTATION=-